jgi:STE24 endopeptidase
MALLRLAFIVVALAWAALALYLSVRQVAFVRRHRDAVPSDFAASVTVEEHRRAADYTVAREKLARVETVVELVVSLAWALGGIGLLYGMLAPIIPNSSVLGVAFLIGTAVVSTILGLPLEVYRAFVLEQAFGFNRTTVSTFMLDHLKSWMIGLVISIPLLFAALWVMQTFTGFWWLWTWAALLLLMVAAPTIYVRLIAPRFNRFTPLEDASLRARIEQLLLKAGFRSSGLFTMDASRRTAHGNAFFIGFGRAKRIVLFDTLLARSAPEEVEAVIAHELGHFRHRHVLFGLAQGAVTMFVALAAIGWLCKQPWLLPSFGVGYENDALKLFVCLQLVSVVGPLLTPVSNWISRRNEFQADDYARRAVGAGPMISALTRLARDNASTLTPDPIYALAHYSHPPVPVRVAHLRAGDVQATQFAASA